MTAENLILLILAQESGRLSGKTLLQKRAYFVSEILDFHLDFRPHYYGPYSDVIDNGIAQCKALGFVQEQTQGFGIVNNGFEVMRYDYSLTGDGEKVVEFLKQENSEECARVSDCLTTLAKAGDFSDYVMLSFAAKTFLILKNTNAPMMGEEIRNAAGRLNWKISPESLQKAIDFLKNADLIKVKTPVECPIENGPSALSISESAV
jgi:uncharacterized protein YwgA